MVFDLGNVLLRWDPYAPFEGRLDRAEVEAFFAEIDFFAFNHLQDAGRSWQAAREAVAESHPHRLVALDLYLEHFAEALPGPVEGSEQIVRDLLRAGVHTYGLTNWSAETFHHAGPAAPAVDLLEGIVVSGVEGIAKPDLRVFALVAARFALDPARTVFTDDSAANVAAAAEAGFDAVLFTDAPSLRAELVARGLPLDGDEGPRT
ncbi:HAD-IA family hydrolase [Cellulomonas soli]|uniref:HAD-IA family hydrolase n=1 Tax=Cellulomonas soli TaxID=931535 RepID=UPI0017EB9225|nr:HAD-IA family hydrolase [Cellulomonas soli]NYI60629.1 2-haloacid dehalogenase [Cellulomonas soli]